MNIQELEELKEKIDKAKEDKAKTEGAIEQIEKRWKDEFECSSVDEVKTKIEKTKNEVEELTVKRDKYIEEIQEAMENV